MESILNKLFLILQTSDTLERIKQFYSFIAITLLIIWFFLKLFINAVRVKRLSTEEKKFFSSFFYLFLSFISLFSLLGLSSNYTNTPWSQLEALVLLYLMVRSLATIALTLILSKADMADFYAHQMGDEQLSKKELLLLVFLSTGFYLFLSRSHSLSVKYPVFQDRCLRLFA
jgi:hypothetical protein